MEKDDQVFVEPTINDFLDCVRTHLNKAMERLRRSISKIEAEAGRAGRGGRTIILIFDAAQAEFDAGISAAFGELKRAIRRTKLDRTELRQHTVQCLENFAIAIKAITKSDQLRAWAPPSVTSIIDQKLAQFDRDLRFAVRQFDTGFFDPGESEDSDGLKTAIPASSRSSREVKQQKIFISYRRDDSKYQARMIYDAFCKDLTRDNVFMDIDSIPPGADFVKILEGHVSECDILLALIGPHWITVADPETNSRRIDEPNDFVRIEIRKALDRGIPVVPVLIDGAQMPDPAQLPNDLKHLARRQAEIVEFRTFDVDVRRLVKKLASPTDGLRSNPPALGDIAERIPDLRVADCPPVAKLFEGKEQDKLVPLLEAEELTAWARPMRVGEPPPIKLPGKIWRTHFLLYCPKTAAQFEQNQTFIKTNVREETVYFDLF